MFSHFGRMYQDMAFSGAKSRHARSAALTLAESVLADYLQGREKLYAVRAIMREIEALFGLGAALPCRLLEDAIVCQDEDRRAGLVARSLGMLGRQVLGEAAADRD